MRALFSIVSLVVVACIVMITVQHQLHAARLATLSPVDHASAPFGGSSQPTPAQFEREVHRALDAGMAARASQSEGVETSR